MLIIYTQPNSGLHESEETHMTEETPTVDKSYLPGDIPFPEEAVGNDATIQEMPEDVYHRIQAFSSSYLRSQVDATPHHALTSVTQTDAMRVGIAFESLFEDAVHAIRENEDSFWSLYHEHRFLTSAPTFMRRCAVKPLDLNKGTGARARAEEWSQQHAGKSLITNVQSLVALTMVKSALSNKGWRRHLLSKVIGEWQQAIFWTEDGVPMQALLDYDYPNSDGARVGVDLKTVNGKISRGHSHDFSAKAANLRYDVQAAHYMTALARIHGEPHVAPFVWLVVEQTRPYGTACYTASQEMCRSGFRQREHAIRRLKRYMDTHDRLPEFPAYSTDDVLLHPPSWHTYRTEGLTAGGI